MKLLRWGIIGPGRIAHKFAQAVQGIEGHLLQAVGSRSIDRAKQFSKQYKIPSYYVSYHKVCEDEEVDVVYIATPHRYHAEEIKMALNSSKVVLCEKPLTVNAAEAEEVVALAGAKNIFLMEAFWSRFLPAWQRVKEWVEKDKIGNIIHITVNFGFPLPKNPEERWLNPHLAGGTLLDMGIYPIALSQFILKKNPTSFSASCLKANTGVDVLTAVSLQYGNHTICQFTTNFLVENENDLLIHGDKGYIHVRKNFWEADHVSLVTREEEYHEAWPHLVNGFEYQIMEVKKCLEQGKIQSEVMPWQDTLDNMRLMDEIRKQLGIRYPFE